MGTRGGREKLSLVSQGHDSPGCEEKVVSFFSPIPDARMEVEKSPLIPLISGLSLASSDPADLWVIGRWLSHGRWLSLW